MTPQPATGTNIAPSGTARLLLKPEPPAFSNVQLTDSRGALVRGLREYLLGLVWDADGGRQLRFKRVREGWAEPEQNAQFPSAAVYTTAPGTYDASSMTPQVEIAPSMRMPDGSHVVTFAALNQDLTLDVWANDPQERMQLVAMLEQALNPVTYRYGFALQLPFYFGQVGTFAPASVQYDDSEDQAIRRYRIARFTIAASVPVTKLVKLPLAKPRFDLRDVGTGSDVIVQTQVT